MFFKLRLYLKTFWRTFVLILAPILLLPIIFSGMTESGSLIDNNGNILLNSSVILENKIPGRKSDYEAMVCAYVLLLMAIYWWVILLKGTGMKRLKTKLLKIIALANYEKRQNVERPTRGFSGLRDEPKGPT